ncbi:hypothetical protein SELMODRAFT_158994 [Selaginella moellendorffii]|uniref:Water stress and hypersensitive response domain-containing protein n=1 Tax=Selaginella moellendorffii TaxID=88036 RepID=D8SWQ7_SELML|nr:late embryogenesis abundant protein Lea14-A [Selaginella moellendorffii]EFJ11064.1 hypothetical protein SELMODRAFT_158994 [Selaginella moellendorffii]|eukprot:XP_002987761.1 late embryogenesis abundant protein Lea14-A [Selaginella moellendorffii]
MSQLVGKAKNFVADKVAHMEKPEADLTWVSVKDVSRSSVVLESDVIITNPYDHDLPVCEISYALFSNNREIVSGKIPDPGSVKANDKTAMKIPAKVPYNVLFTIVKDVGTDWDLDYEMRVGLTVDIPILGNFTIPLSKKGSFKLPLLPF